MVPVEALRELVEQDGCDLDPVGEGLGDALGVHVGIGSGALGEQDAHVRAGPLALGGGGERGLGNLVGREAKLGRAAQGLRDDPARASEPRRTGGRSTTRVPAPCRSTT